ncbi:hypothetical protein KM043_011714 [Ampulex compressa]|nr:hypothetical protein KM043_011714 [Ampulex compressa]
MYNTLLWFPPRPFAMMLDISSHWLYICIIGCNLLLLCIDGRHFTSFTHREAVALYLSEKGFSMDPAEVRQKAFDEDGDYILCNLGMLSFYNASAQKEKTIESCCGHLNYCKTFVAPWESKFGLKNAVKYKMLECACVGMFSSCVSSTKDNDIRNIGKLYFNIVKPKCFLKLYRATCDRPFYDEQNNTYPSNEREKYFCIKTYTYKNI